MCPDIVRGRAISNRLVPGSGYAAHPLAYLAGRSDLNICRQESGNSLMLAWALLWNRGVSETCVNAGPSSSADEASWKTFARLLAGRDLSGVVLAEKLTVFFWRNCIVFDQRTTKGTPQLQRMTSFRRKWHSLLKPATEGGSRLDFRKKLKNATRQAVQKVRSAGSSRPIWAFLCNLCDF